MIRKGIILKILIVGIFISYVRVGFSQNHFNINSIIGDSLIICVNSDTIILNKVIKNVKTNYPVFDTLTFLSPCANANQKIICNFKPDTIYNVTLACCGSLDIIPASKFRCDSLNYWDGEKDFEKIKGQLLDRPKFFFKLNKFVSDTIFGWYGDLACNPKVIRVENKPSFYGVPIQCFYWNNISYFVFFKADTNYFKLFNKNGVIEEYPNSEKIEILSEIQVRLFDNQTFILELDVNSKKIKLKYN